MTTSRNHSPRHLSDTALLLLGRAADSDNQMILPIPKSVRARGKALERTLRSLLNRGSIEEVAVGPADEAWRSDDHGRYGLRITRAGLKAIGVPALMSGLTAAGHQVGQADHHAHAARGAIDRRTERGTGLAGPYDKGGDQPAAEERACCRQGEDHGRRERVSDRAGGGCLMACGPAWVAELGWLVGLGVSAFAMCWPQRIQPLWNRAVEPHT
jgi:hypothetical protein